MPCETRTHAVLFPLAHAARRARATRWTLVDVAEGWIGLAVSERGLRACTLPRFTGSEASAALRAALPAGEDGLHPEPGERLAPQWEDALRAYFLGQRVDFCAAPLDLRGASSFQQVVWEACRRVGYGQTATYGQLAAWLGHPEAARAVGQALGANPLPIVVPCHRVVGAGGRPTGYRGGLGWKQWLLRWEESFA